MTFGMANGINSSSCHTLQLYVGKEGHKIIVKQQKKWNWNQPAAGSLSIYVFYVCLHVHIYRVTFQSSSSPLLVEQTGKSEEEEEGTEARISFILWRSFPSPLSSSRSQNVFSCYCLKKIHIAKQSQEGNVVGTGWLAQQNDTLSGQPELNKITISQFSSGRI